VFVPGSLRSVLRKHLPHRKTSEIRVMTKVERGDRAVVILPGKQRFSLVREGRECKSDD